MEDMIHAGFLINRFRNLLYIMKTGPLLIDLIKTIPLIKKPAHAAYENEKSINPAYCDLEHSSPLCPHEKKIWVLRGDLIFAVGAKNAYTTRGNTKITDVFDTSLHKYLDLGDRYGHPSLTIPEQNYDGSAYSAGWLYQHSNRLEVFLHSGRYHNKGITILQQRYLERYISMQIMSAYGEQDVIFFDYEDPNEISLFLTGNLFSSDKSRRTYSPATIKNKTLLDLAIEHEDDNVAIRLFEAGAKTSSAINGEKHIIHILARNGLLNYMQTLIERAPELIHLKDRYQRTPLLCAASRGYCDVVNYLITQGANVNLETQLPVEEKAQTENDFSPLDWAIKGGHVTTIILLMNSGAKAHHAHTRVKNKLIIYLIKAGSLGGVQLLVKSNPALINAIDKYGYALLHYAAYYAQNEIVRYLIAEGANIDLPTVTHENIQYSNMTAMDILLQNQVDDTLAILLFEAGGKIPLPVNGKYHLIHLFAKNGLLHHVQTLVEKEPGLVHLKDSRNQTPLLWAASRGHHEVVAFLIAQGADVNLPTCQENNAGISPSHHHYSPLDWAIERDHEATISILIKAGAIANHMNVPNIGDEVLDVGVCRSLTVHGLFASKASLDYLEKAPEQEHQVARSV